MIQEVRISTTEDLMPLLSEQEYRPDLGRNRVRERSVDFALETLAALLTAGEPQEERA